MIDAIAGAVGGNLPVAAAVLIAYMAGAATPGGYAMERINGFGRVVASKLPYQPPPGMEETEALEAASEGVDGGATDE
ncbi:hypothetical protein [Halorubrum salinum]|uniref:hypothetical protein n=1 Tax=Halorubrum salinum TaxID=767517 RepID=UPI0021112228|nr:hypothetical protein [Halorubrum salinum]